MHKLVYYYFLSPQLTTIVRFSIFPPTFIALNRRSNHQHPTTTATTTQHYPPENQNQPKIIPNQLKPTKKPIPNPMLLLPISPCQYHCECCYHQCSCYHQIYCRQAGLGWALLIRISSEEDEREMMDKRKLRREIWGRDDVSKREREDGSKIGKEFEEETCENLDKEIKRYFII